MARTALLFVLTMVTCSASAADALSLGQLLDGMLRGHPEVVRLQAEVQRSEARVRQAGEAFDWQLYAEAAYRRPYVPQSQNGVLTTETDTNDVYDLSLGASKRLRNGIRIAPGVTVAQNQDEQGSDVLAESRNIGFIGLQVPLLRGAGEAVVTADERAAGEALNATTLDSERGIAAFIYEGVAAYWRTLQLELDLAARRQVVAEAAEVVDAMAMLSARGELPAVRFQRSRAEQALRGTRVNQADAAWQNSRRELVRYVRGQESAGAELPAPAGPFPEVRLLPEGAEALIAIALERRRDLRALEHRQGMAQIRLERARDDNRPQLDFNLAADKVSISFNQRFGASGQGRVGEQMAALIEAQAEQQALRDTIRSEISQLLQQLRVLATNYTAAREACDLLVQVVADMRSQAERGLVGRADLIETIDQLADSRIYLHQLQKEYAIGLAALRLATGTLPLSADGNMGPTVQALSGLEDLFTMQH